jgi:hypothetical protein
MGIYSCAIGECDQNEKKNKNLQQIEKIKDAKVAKALQDSMLFTRLDMI